MEFILKASIALILWIPHFLISEKYPIDKVFFKFDKEKKCETCTEWKCKKKKGSTLT